MSVTLEFFPVATSTMS